MNESALSSPYAALEQKWNCGQNRQSARLVNQNVVSLTTECRLPNAALYAAIPCTVTHPGTSVTTPALVESGLIIVSRASGRWAETAAGRGFAGIVHCSFAGGLCIQ